MELKTVRDIILEVNNIDIFEQKRTRNVIEMRSVANTFMYNVCEMRLTEMVREYAKYKYNTTHASIIHSLNSYEEHCKHNKNLDLTYERLLGDTKLCLMQQIPKATDQQIELIEEILLG